MSKLYFLRPDDLLSGYTRPADPEKGWPMVHRMYPLDNVVQLTERLQNFWFNLNYTRGRDVEVEAWNSYVDAAFTSGIRLRGGANYITGERLWAPLPRMIPAAFGRNVYRGDATRAYGLRGIENGSWVLKIETIDLNKYPVFSMKPQDYPWLFGVANIITPKLVNGIKQVNAFTQRGGRPPGLPVYYPLWSYGECFLPFHWFDELDENAPLPSPYYPA